MSSAMSDAAGVDAPKNNAAIAQSRTPGRLTEPGYRPPQVHSVGPEPGAELSIGELVAATGAAVSPKLVTVRFRRAVAACLGTLDLWTARQSADQALDLVFLLERTTGFEPTTLTLARHGSSELKCSRVRDSGARRRHKGSPAAEDGPISKFTGNVNCVDFIAHRTPPEHDERHAPAEAANRLAVLCPVAIEATGRDSVVGVGASAW